MRGGGPQPTPCFFVPASCRQREPLVSCPLVRCPRAWDGQLPSTNAIAPPTSSAKRQPSFRQLPPADFAAVAMTMYILMSLFALLCPEEAGSPAPLRPRVAGASPADQFSGDCHGSQPPRRRGDLWQHRRILG